MTALFNKIKGRKFTYKKCNFCFAEVAKNGKRMEAHIENCNNKKVAAVLNTMI